MQTTLSTLSPTLRQFPPFDLVRLLKTVFRPKPGEKICIIVDLDNPAEVKDFAFLKTPGLPVQKKAYEVFYQGLNKGAGQQLGLKECDFFAYQTTGGSNLELPETALNPQGKAVRFDKDIYPIYDIILCITNCSATAPMTAAAKKFGFRGATMHGMNDTVLKTGLAVDYDEVSRQAEKLRNGMTHAETVDIDFEVDNQPFHLHIELGSQNAQKSHGLCREEPDVVNLPAGEVYFVPIDATGSFPIKFDDGTLGVMKVDQCHITKVSLLKGNQKTINEMQEKIETDPACGVLGELGFGTQILPYSGADIQDEKIFGTFHVATGRNDHLNGSVTLDRFKFGKNATHEDILFSSTKTPEIHVKQVSMHREGKREILIENYEPSVYLWNLLEMSPY